MVRDPWTFAAAVIAFGMMAWLVICNPKSHAPRNDFPQSLSLSAEPDLRLVTERSPYMRTER